MDTYHKAKVSQNDWADPMAYVFVALINDYHEMKQISTRPKTRDEDTYYDFDLQKSRQMSYALKNGS